MSEINTPRFFFSEAQVLQRVFIVYGNLSDYYITPAKCWLSFDRAIASHLRFMGYDVVIFFDGTQRMECADAQSARIRREKLPTDREKRQRPPQNQGNAPRQPAGAQQGGGNTMAVPQGLFDDIDLDTPPQQAQQAPQEEKYPLIFEEQAEQVPDYLDRVMHATDVKVAVVMCDCMSMMESNSNGGVSIRDLTRKMSRWYGMPAENENIAVMLFDVPRIVTLHDTLMGMHMWNFLFERSFNGNNPTDSVLRIGCPNMDEIRIVLTDEVPAYVSPALLRAINPVYTNQALESAANQLVQAAHGSLKALRLFLHQHPQDAVAKLMERYGQGQHEDALETIRTTEGWEAVYKVVAKIVNMGRSIIGDETQRQVPFYNLTNLRMAYPETRVDSSVNLSMLLCGNPGTGKTTVVQKIATALQQNGLLPTDRVNKVTRDNLVGDHIGETALKTKSCIEEAMGGVLFVDEAYSLFHMDNKNTSHADFGIEAIDTLLEAISDRRGQISIIMAGYPEDMKHLLTANSGLPRRFDGNIITIDDYKPDLLERIFLRFISKENRRSAEDNIPTDQYYTLSADLAGSDKIMVEVLDMVEKDRTDRENRTLSPLSIFFNNWYADRDRATFGNAGAAEELARAVMEHARARTDIEDGEIRIEKADFGDAFQKLFTNRSPSIEDLDEQMQDVVGMEKVKASLARVVSYLQMCKTQEALGGMVASEAAEPGHYLFVGNPGTGKTMISEKLGMALCSMGMIGKYKPVRMTGLDLINILSGGNGIGALKKELKKCVGGVLVIDEAHQLCDNGASGLGKMVIKCLLDPMIENRHELSVVFCCYPNEREALLQCDPGLARRISDVFIFEDYTPQELCKIFVLKAQKERYSLAVGAEEAVEQAFMILQTMNMLENGSSAEKMLKEIKVNMALRLRDKLPPLGASKKAMEAFTGLHTDLYTILPEDVDAAVQRMITNMTAKAGIR